MDNAINITGLDKAAVLAALYNRARVQGMGIFQARPGDMSIAEAQAILDGDANRYFDYLHGRVMKVDLEGDEFSPRLYDRDNGDGAAKRALEPLMQVAATE